MSLPTKYAFQPISTQTSTHFIAFPLRGLSPLLAPLVIPALPSMIYGAPPAIPYLDLCAQVLRTALTVLGREP
ncbi:hypothetical protein L226DRAFT_538171 [Lentinus tigrinus ALCF2SS1-7]|uniref:uncharacterized protein n=1 Tax=Lentinus tigrinus ALCF2SS1-7 TaxID=1328758 RepID=UPI0011663E3D|nr:hypothetical protein L226DRAFT_538171 [Lentinus tigrinus ALCF2SS1-7]